MISHTGRYVKEQDYDTRERQAHFRSYAAMVKSMKKKLKPPEPASDPAEPERREDDRG